MAKKGIIRIRYEVCAGLTDNKNSSVASGMCNQSQRCDSTFFCCPTVVILFFKGTVLYTAPEILLGKTPTFKSDVYSLGILMWQLITREQPFAEIDKSEILIYKVIQIFFVIVFLLN